MSSSKYTHLNIKLDVEAKLSRLVLCEKYNFDKARQIEMTEFFWNKLDGAELFLHEDYKKIIFYFKKNKTGKYEYLMEKNNKTRYYYIRYSNFWQVFEEKYGINYDEIQSFTESLLEEGVNSQPFKTPLNPYGDSKNLEEGVNSQPFKTVVLPEPLSPILEEGVNSQPFKTSGYEEVTYNNLEEGVNSQPFKTFMGATNAIFVLEEGVNSQPFKTYASPK